MRYRNGVVCASKEITSPVTINSKLKTRDTIPKLLWRSNQNFAALGLPAIPKRLLGHHKYTPEISKNNAANADHLTVVCPNTRPLSNRANRRWSWCTKPRNSKPPSIVPNTCPEYWSTYTSCRRHYLVRKIRPIREDVSADILASRGVAHRIT